MLGNFRMRIGAVLVWPLLVGSSVVQADGLPLGGRTAAMGGAATATGRDGAMPFINPAGFARVPRTTLSLSASLYRNESVSVDPFYYHGQLDPRLGQLAGTPHAERNGLGSSRFSGLPGAASVLWHIGGTEENPREHVFSLSAMSTEASRRTFEGDFALAFGDGSTVFRDSYTEVSENDVTNFGPGYAVRLNRLSLGASALFAYESFGHSVQSNTTAITSRGYVLSEEKTFVAGYAFAFQPVVGVQWNPWRGLALGLSIAPPSLHLTGYMSGQSSGQIGGPAGTTNQVQASRSEGDYKRVYPMRIHLGAAYEKDDDWAVAFDLRWQAKQDGAFVQRFSQTIATQEQGLDVAVVRLDQDVSDDVRSTLGVHVGGEKSLSRNVAIRAGAFYEPSPTNLGRTRRDLMVMQIDRYGATLGTGIHGTEGETTVGVEFVEGRGHTVAADAFSQAGAMSYRTVDANSWSLTLFIAGAVELGERDKAQP